jgi:hypothetical protein
MNMLCEDAVGGKTLKLSMQVGSIYVKIQQTNQHLDQSIFRPQHTWGEGLLQLVGLLGVIHAQRVEVLGATNLELDSILAPLDPHRAGILPPCGEKEVFDLVDLLRLQGKRVIRTSKAS